MAVISVRERLAPPGHPDFGKMSKEQRVASTRRHAHELADQVEKKNAGLTASANAELGNLVGDSATFIAGEAVDPEGASRHNPDDVAYAYAKQIGEKERTRLGIDLGDLRKKARRHGRTI